MVWESEGTDEMSRAKKSDVNFLMQGSLLAVASIISRVIGLVYRLPLTAIIGKEGNNYYGTAFEIYNLILLISSYSIPLAVSKLVATRMAEGQVRNAWRFLKGALLFATVSGGSFALVVWFGADFFTARLLATPLASIALKVLAPVIFLVAIAGVLRGFFQGLNSMMPTALSQIAEQIVNAVVSVVAAYFLYSFGAKAGAVLGDKAEYAAAWGAAGGTLGTAMGALTSLAFLIFVISIYRKRFRRMMRKDKTGGHEKYGDILWLLLSTIVPVLLSTTLYNISSIIDQAIFKNYALFQGIKQHTIDVWWGVYAGQYRVIINVPISIASSIAASSVPALITSYKGGDMADVRAKIHSATRFIMVIAFPCTIGIFALAGPVQRLLFSDTDPTSAYMLMVGAVSVLFYSLSTLSNGLLQGIDKLRIPVKNAAISLVLQAVFLVGAMQLFNLGIYAVILANAFYAFLMCLLNGRAVIKYSGTHQDVRSTYITPLAGSVIMGIAVYLVYILAEGLTGSNALGTILAFFAGVFVYFVVMLLLKGITEEELRRIPHGNRLIAIAERMHLL